MKRLILLCGFVILQILFIKNVSATNSYSSMVNIEGTNNIYLVVDDLKYTNENDNEPRIGTLTIDEKEGAIYNPLKVDDWLDTTKPERQPNDLEACCAIPGRTNEYLLAESGLYKNKFGRIFHICFTHENRKVRVLSSFKIYNRELDEKGTSFKGYNVEGIACFQAFKKTILVYSERGGEAKDGVKLARLFWGEINFSNSPPVFNKLGEDDLVTQSILKDRDSADLFLKSEGKKIDIYSIATIDRGNNGPFKSVIYKAGSFVLNTEKEVVNFEREQSPEVIYTIDGLKVEAIASTTNPESPFCIGTDDENFGGIWRPLPK